MKKIITMALFVSFFLVTNESFAFLDSPPSYVEYLETQGVFSEEELARNFSEKKPTTRGMLLSWAMNLNEVKANNESQKSAFFTDLLENNSLSPLADIALQTGSLEQWNLKEKFIPKKKITKIEALSFLFEIENVSLLEGSLESNSFIKDLPKNPIQKAILLTALSKNIITPNEENKILPNASLSKGELAKIMTKIHKMQHTTPEKFSQNSDYETITKLIEKNYLKREDVDMNVLNDTAFTEMLKSLGDPYSVYMPPEESENFNNYIEESHPTVKGYAGIGASVQESGKNGGFVIAELFEQSPAYQAGVRVGDIVVGVDGTDITKMTLNEAISLVKGAENTIVALKILRAKKEMFFDVIRKKIVIDHFDNTSVEIKDDIVWIKVRGFKAFAADEFKDALAKITPETKGIIVDLRYNPGGLLESSQEMLGELLPAKHIASRLIEHGQETLYEVVGSGEYTQIPLVVFQNEYSASASEIFSASIKDYERGKIIGTTSFGKGVAQNLFFLQRGSVKLTTAEFISPLGNTIHKKGVAPDILLENQDDETYFNAAKNVFRK